MPRSKRNHEAWGGGLAYADGKIYVSSGFREVVQLDARTGGMGWRTRTDAPVHAAPTVADGRVFVVDVNDELLGLQHRRRPAALDLSGADRAGAHSRRLQPRGGQRHAGHLVRLRRTGRAARGERQRTVERQPVARQPHQRPLRNPRHRGAAGDLQDRRLRGEPCRLLRRGRSAHRLGPLDLAGVGDHHPLGGGRRRLCRRSERAR